MENEEESMLDRMFFGEYQPMDAKFESPELDAANEAFHSRLEALIKNGNEDISVLAKSVEDAFITIWVELHKQAFEQGFRDGVRFMMEVKD